MDRKTHAEIEEAKAAALGVLHHNAHGPYHQLPRTAGWGYPEPYTRDLMIAALGVLVSGDAKLVKGLRRVFEVLAKNQSRLGHIPSLVHNPEDRGASDTTPLFLIALGAFRQATGETDFLEEAARKALTWMDYQSPEDRSVIAQQPTSDWRDEQWIIGFGLFVNTMVYTYLRMFGNHDRATLVRTLMNRFTVTGSKRHPHIHGNLVLRSKPYYAAWSYKQYGSERFDLLGNSLAILSGVAAPSRARSIIAWVETECRALREQGDLAVDLPPNFFPYTRPEDPDWRARYADYNQPGEYHNGGIWPFICGFYIAAVVAAGMHPLAERRLLALTRLVRPSRSADVPFGFNEWIRAQDGQPCGQDWQTWSAAMYLYAAACVKQRSTPFFEEIRVAFRKRCPSPTAAAPENPPDTNLSTPTTA